MDHLSIYIDFRIYFTSQNSLDWSWSPLTSVPSVDPLDFFLNYPAMAYRKVPAENNLALIHKCTILICYSWLRVYFIGEIGTGVGVTYERYDRGKNLHKQSKRFLQTLTLLECDTWTMVGSAVSCHPAVGQFYFSNLSKEMNPYRYLESWSL